MIGRVKSRYFASKSPTGEPMTIVPWFEVPTEMDASHRVRAPGGYERWSFDAADAASDVRVVAVLEGGSATDPE